MSLDSNTPVTLGNRKLVVLGIPWDIDTEGLRQFMTKYGELSDVIVMKDRATGRSRGFGYVTFATSESAEKALGTSHFLNGRMLDVKVATPKEVMPPQPQRQPPPPPPAEKKSSRIFVARVPLSVTDEMFRSYFEKYGVITDLYMPKDKGSRSHRGIGFLTFENSDSVDKIMAETHQIAGTTVAVDRATPKEEPGKNLDKLAFPYGVFNSYLNAAARLGFFGMPPFFPLEYPGYGFPSEMGGAAMQASTFGAGHTRPHQLQMPSGKGPVGFAEHKAESSSFFNRNASHAPAASHVATPKPTGKKIFIGRIPIEATAEDVRSYFSKFGPLIDVYLPKDKEKTTHRGFGFVTFAEESSVEQVVSRSHELRGQMLAIDQAAPIGEAPSAGAFYNPNLAAASSGAGGPGPIRGGNISGSSTSALSGGYGYPDPWALYSSLPTSSSKMEPRYRPY